jgi:glycosyltransferase involved in cell wall biosynthesis
MRVLHLLSQRPSLTGSGVTLDAMVRHAAAAGWEQHVVVGVPTDDPFPSVGGLERERVHPLSFGSGRLDFPVPGMSDVMPYPSTVFGAMTDDQMARYLGSWVEHVTRVLDLAEPDVIHSHHIWVLSSILKDLAPDAPVVTHCHATGLRQMELVPSLADRVRTGCARNDAFVVLHRAHAAELVGRLQVTADRVHRVGAGYRDDLFHPRGRDPNSPPAIVYVGKYSAAKGLPQLLDAFDRLSGRHRDLVLHIAGNGSGSEAEALRQRMIAAAPRVLLHGQLDQAELAELMRRCTVCVLPSFYEGLPLVLVEAMACGCRLVASSLPGVTDELAPQLKDGLEVVSLPPMEGVDRPRSDDLPAFVARLSAALERAVAAPRLDDWTGRLEPFTWGSVFARIEDVWRRVIRDSGS